MIKPIFSALSPNVESDDLNLAKNLLRGFLDHKNDYYVEQLVDSFKDYLGAEEVFAFDSGRSALYEIIKSLNYPAGSELLVPGFTCAAAINPLIWAGLKPVFIDINQSLNINYDILPKKVNSRTRAILAQHTFGLPLNMSLVSEFARKHKLMVIEDCAHSLGASWNGKPTGLWGQASFFSFGRDKIISSVFGGLAVVNDSNLSERLRKQEKNLILPPRKWIQQQLKHPIIIDKWIKPLYGYGELGRKILLLMQKTGILSKAMSREEKRGGFREVRKMPEEMAALALNQFLKMGRHNDHRRNIASFYYQELKDLPIQLPLAGDERVYLKFPIILSRAESADRLMRLLRFQKIHLYDGWKDSPVVPSDVGLSSMGYRIGDCPVAEGISRRLVNLPTHINISPDDAARITRAIKEHLRAL